MEYTKLQNLRAEDYIYPEENQIFIEICKVPLLDKMIGEAIAGVSNAFMRPQVESSYYHVTETTCPRLHALYELAKARLDIHADIPLFIKPEFDFNACSVGGSSPYIVLHSSFVKNCPDDVLLFVLGHELGHNKGNHAVYQTIARLLLADPMRGKYGSLVKTGALISLCDWARMQEHSADRAGAIAAGGTQQALRGLQVLMGAYGKVKGVNVSEEDMLCQIRDYQAEQCNKVSHLMMLSMLVTMSHPWSVKRIEEMKKWEESGEFDALIARKAVC